MPGYLGNFPNAWVSGKFPKYSVIWEISKILKIYHFENSPNSCESGKLPKYLDIWGISHIDRHLEKYTISRIPQMPGNLGNPKFRRESGDNLFLSFRKFLKCLDIWEISKIPKYLANSYFLEKYNCCRVMGVTALLLLISM